jgi:hypothetical protein
MTPDDFLHSLRKKLKGFSPIEQAELIEEIGSHIESGGDDSRLGKDPANRRQNLMSELGSPGEMAKGFRKIYQPGRVIDYLLIAIPLLLNLPINLLLVSLMPKYPWTDVRLVMIFHMILIAIGLWRRSILLTLFWVADLAGQLMFVLWLFHGPFDGLQTIFWYVVLAGLIILLGRMVWQNRGDILIVTFALLPFIMSLLAVALRHFANGNTYAYEPLEIFFFRIYLMIPNFVWFTEVFILIPFFLVKDRNVRWLSLAVYWLFLGLSRNGLDYQVIFAPPVYYLWIFLPTSPIALGWLLERYKKRLVRLAT